MAKRFGDTLAVADLSLRVERGSIFGFLGPNGAGKTTSVKMLLGLVRPSAGKGSVLGAPIGDRAARARIGYLPELFRYQEWLTGREVLAFHAALAGIARTERSKQVARALEIAGLSTRGNDRVAGYSKGMQQRLGLAAALLGEPELVFLDEPTSALDPVGRYDVRDLLRTLAARGTTVFLNSHLLTEVEQVCDRVAIVRAGRVVASGTPADIAGARLGVRVRASANGVPLQETLAAFGNVVVEDGGAFVGGVADDRVPDVVAALVAAGARVYAVSAVSQSLEDRFLEMMSAP
ncbi:MAG TPA: ABC transporter ATP-binding protein [Candidatus Acidoferrales bacterium]|jgi:ABC-2 type transport system ATP-binding protein|nr:ABC transporter ATP-binding protein [Candidatus Acidoferrales bacterium]